MILLLDTSIPEAKLTVVTEGVQQEVSWHADRQLAKGLLDWMRRVLEEHDSTWQDITGIGVYRGPGSFTGLRIGIAVCNTLADSLDVAIVGETGDDWRDLAIDRLSAGETDRVVLPEYGSAARITTPRK